MSVTNWFGFRRSIEIRRCIVCNQEFRAMSWQSKLCQKESCRTTYKNRLNKLNRLKRGLGKGRNTSGLKQYDNKAKSN
jgi:hypothetical protein